MWLSGIPEYIRADIKTIIRLMYKHKEQSGFYGINK